MNIKTLLMLAFICLNTLVLRSQAIELRKVDLGKLQGFTYVGTDDKHVYYKSSGYQLHRFEKDNMNNKTTVNYKLDNDEESSYESHILNNRFIVVSRFSDASKEIKKSSLAVYAFDPATGAKIKRDLTLIEGKSTVYFSTHLDKKNKEFIITVSDSIVNKLNYDIEKVSFVSGAKYKTPNYQFESLFDLEYLLKSFSNLGSKFTITTIDQGKVVYKDSVSTENFLISYEKTEDKDIHFFNRYYHSVNIIGRKKDVKSREVDFTLSSDKIIIDMLPKTDMNGNLLLIGKYMIKNGSTNHYGMFSVKYDPLMNEMEPVRYFDIMIADAKFESVPNIKYIGLIFTKLAYPKNTFELENGTRVMIYQKDYNNVQDHIYILKVEDNGQITTNVVPNQQVINKKSPYMTETFVPVLVKDRILFVLYENALNMDSKASEIRIHWTTVGKKNTLLVSCYYDITNDDVTRKKEIADASTYKVLPHLNEYHIYYDENNSNTICLIPAQKKKNQTKALYYFQVPN